MIRPSIPQLEQTILANIKSQTGVSISLDDTILGLIIKSTAQLLDGVYAEYENLERQKSLFTATGESLENWGLLFGVRRNQTTRASSTGFTRPCRFTNLTTSSQVIPSGTRVWNSENPQLAFFTTEAITLSAGNSGEVHIDAEEAGSLYNIPVGYLNNHSLTTANITVTNITPIINGAEQESDDSLRGRIIREFQRKATFNADICSSYLRQIGNVKEAIVMEFKRGVGTYDVILDLYSFENAESTVQLARDLLAEASPLGISYNIDTPKLRYLDINISLTFKPNSLNQDAIRSEIRAQINALISSLPVETGSGNGSLFLDQINGIAQASDLDIISINPQYGLDQEPIDNTGQVTINVGERIILRTINIQ